MHDITIQHDSDSDDDDDVPTAKRSKIVSLDSLTHPPLLCRI